MNVLDLAQYIIKRHNDLDINIDHLKLQKLLYYIQGYSLKEYNVPAFDEEIEHWEHGPVVPQVFQKFKTNKYRPIILNEMESLKSPTIALIRVCDEIIKVCQNDTAKELENRTHTERPWKETKLNEIISKDELKDFFSEDNPLNITFERLSSDNYKKYSKAILEKDKNIFKVLS